MSRQSSNADKKLLLEGRKLLIKKGASALSIRELTGNADVNLGMFSYYFKTKDNFVEKVLDEIYSEFMLQFDLGEEGDDLEILRSQLIVVAKFARNNRSLILSLLSDVLNEDKVVQKFVKVKMRKHFFLLGRTLVRCQKKGLIIKAPLPLLITQIASSIGLSNLIPDFLKRLGINKAFDMGLSIVTKDLTSDETINQRVNILLRGISV